MSQSIIELVDNLPRRSMTVRLMQALDWIVPGEYVNLVGWEETIRAVSGETDAAFIQTVGRRAVELYNDPKHGYQRGLWIYRTVDSVQGVAGWMALLSKLGEDFGIFSWFRKMTPKEDTTQAIDLAIKLTAEIVAFCTVNGMPGDRVDDFVESLSDFENESRMRMATLIAADGILPLGPDFIDKAIKMIDGSKNAVTENERFKRLRGLIPGDSATEQVNFMEHGMKSVKDWVGNFVAKHDITQNRVLQSIQGLSEHLEGRLDYAAAFLDMTTDYYEHTGIQSVARSLITRATNEV
ncbi:MAG: hypothetical protein KDA80_22770 [Planctomycetaceae bacterium]|nr:hypothetical protein [Planctomycetaceae bacterium]